MVAGDWQSSESSLVGRQSTVGLLRDLLSQFSKLSDEADVTDSEHEVDRVSEQLIGLNDRLSARRAAVEVFLLQFMYGLLCIFLLFSQLLFNQLMCCIRHNLSHVLQMNLRDCYHTRLFVRTPNIVGANLRLYPG